MDNNSSSPSKLTQLQAQRLMVDLTSLAMKQVDIAARSTTKARDRARALRKLDRAIEILSPDLKKS